MKKHPTRKELVKLLGDSFDASTFRCEEFVLNTKGNWEYQFNEKALMRELKALHDSGAPKPKPNTRLGNALATLMGSGKRKHMTKQELSRLILYGFDASTFRREDFVLDTKGNWEYKPDEKAQKRELLALAKSGAPRPKPNTRLGIAFARFTTK